MPQRVPLQQAFSAGEITPKMHYRVDTRQHLEGCSTLNNFIAKARGPAQSRDGFRFVGKVIASMGPEPPTTDFCGNPVGADSGSAVSLGTNFNVDASETLGIVVASGEPSSAGSTRQIIAIDADTMNVLFFRNGCSRSGHMIFSSVGSLDRRYLAFLEWPCGGGTRSMYFFDMDDGFNQVGDAHFANENMQIMAENNLFIICNESVAGNQAIIFDKGTPGAYTVLTSATGWFPRAAAAVSPVMPAGLMGHFLILMEDAGQWGFTFYTDETSLPDPAIPLGTSPGGGSCVECISIPVTEGDNVWWHIRTDDTNVEDQNWLVKTNYQGIQSQWIPAFNNEVGLNVVGYQFNQLNYRASNHSLYYSRDETLWRYSIQYDSYFKCTPAYPPEFGVVNQTRSLAGTRIGDFHFDIVPQFDNDNWGIERIEATF